MLWSGGLQLLSGGKIDQRVKVERLVLVDVKRFIVYVQSHQQLLESWKKDINCFSYPKRSTRVQVVEFNHGPMKNWSASKFQEGGTTRKIKR